MDRRHVGAAARHVDADRRPFRLRQLHGLAGVVRRRLRFLSGWLYGSQRGLPHGLDRAAVDAIQQWRYKPATLAGQPVKVYFTLTVNFTIQR